MTMYPVTITSTADLMIPKSIICEPADWTNMTLPPVSSLPASTEGRHKTSSDGGADQGLLKAPHEASHQHEEWQRKGAKPWHRFIS